MNINKYITTFGLSLYAGQTTLSAAVNSDINITKTEKNLDLIHKMSEYGTLITDSIYFIVIGMFVIYLLHMLTSKFLYPYVKNRRIIKVFFGALYALILVISVLMVLDKLGFDVSNLGKVSVLTVMVVSVIIFFLLPFLPRLPFVTGNMVEINGVLGIVDSITTYHTTLRKFDGTIVFIPNALIIASKIMNYHDTPHRRIDLNLDISIDSNVNEVEKLLKALMSNNEHVLRSPAPAVFVTSVEASGIKLLANCWVKNENWLSVRSQIWIQIQKESIKNEQISLSRSEQEIYFRDMR